MCVCVGWRGGGAGGGGGALSDLRPNGIRDIHRKRHSNVYLAKRLGYGVIVRTGRLGVSTPGLDEIAHWSFFFCLSIYFYFFLPLVPVGVAGRYSCLSAARRVTWRRDIPWVLRMSATESLHRFLGLSIAARKIIGTDASLGDTLPVSGLCTGHPRNTSCCLHT